MTLYFSILGRSMYQWDVGFGQSTRQWIAGFGQSMYQYLIMVNFSNSTKSSSILGSRKNVSHDQGRYCAHSSSDSVSRMV